MSRLQSFTPFTVVTTVYSRLHRFSNSSINFSSTVNGVNGRLQCPRLHSNPLFLCTKMANVNDCKRL